MVSARNVLWVVVFCGFAVNYMNRINVNIAIVAMVQPPKVTSNSSSVCYVQPQTNATQGIVSAEKVDARFTWDERQQNEILGGFYWVHWVLQIPGGILARRWGTKLIFGLSNFLCSLLLFAMPAAAYADYRLLVVIRVLQGLISGAAWPAMHNMAAQWTPPNERSKFVSSYLGSSVGIALTYPLCAYLMTLLGWESVFYVTGLLGSLWYVAWLYLAFDSPALHPRIDLKERLYIEKNIGDSYDTDQLAVPWKAILTSRPVWVSVVTQWGASWGIFTLMTQSPTYFGLVLGIETTMTGVFSGVPHLLRSAFAIAFAHFSDHLLAKEYINRTNVRKMAVAVSMVGQGVLVAALPLCGCNSAAAVVVLFIAVAVHGAYSTGPLSNMVDLSPNFASVSQGLAGTICMSSGTISAYIVGQLTYQNQSLEQWAKVYWLTAAIIISSAVLSMLCTTSDVQDWNSPKKRNKDEENEIEQLKTDS